MIIFRALGTKRNIFVENAAVMIACQILSVFLDLRIQRGQTMVADRGDFCFYLCKVKFDPLHPA